MYKILQICLLMQITEQYLTLRHHTLTHSCSEERNDEAYKTNCEFKQIIVLKAIHINH